MKRVLLAIPNDPIHRYFEKGEIKPRYYNPGDCFDEVHLVTFDEWDKSPETVQIIAGKARLFIHPLGKLSYLRLPILLKRTLRLAKTFQVDVVRAYNPTLQGLLATLVGILLGLPVVISVHGNYDKDLRELMKLRIETFTPLKLLKAFVIDRVIEEFVLRKADLVIGAYKFAADYATAHGARRVRVVYNRVYAKQFSWNRSSASERKRLTVLCVGRMERVKNQECLVRAVKNLDVNLVLIGDGPLREGLEVLAKKLGIQAKITFIRSVPNVEIHKFYYQSDIFAIPIEYGGICIPVLEAMTAGLPLILPKPRWEKEPELAAEAAIVAENTPEGFEEGLRRLIEDANLRRQLGERGRAIMKSIQGETMERREMELYEELLQMRNVPRR